MKDSGLFEEFCDYHCHLLPGVDDGVKEMDETLQILERWDSLGVKTVWITPHIMEDIPNEPNDLRIRFEELKANYKGNIELHLAAENMMDNLFLKRLQMNELMPIGHTRTHLLLETSYYNPPMDMNSIIESVKKKGYTPVLAHPERYQYMNMENYAQWRNKGVIMQLNIPSLVGAYGPIVQKKAEILLDNGMYDCCGTDTHSLRFVETFLQSKIHKKNVQAIRKLMGNQQL